MVPLKLAVELSNAPESSGQFIKRNKFSVNLLNAP
jgi:hypothetical protein